MPKSKIFKEIINDEINVLQAIDRLYLIARDLKDDSVCEWIKKEKNGYFDTEAPDYRKVRVSPVGSYQIFSGGYIEKYNNVPLPTSNIPEKNLEEFRNWYVKDGISVLLSQKQSCDKGEIVGIPLDPVYFPWFEKNTRIIMRSAMLRFNSSDFEMVLNAIKDRIIDLLLYYEENFGNLDNFDLDFSDLPNKKLKHIQSGTKSIIDTYFGGKTKIVLKKVNLGKDNSISDEKSIETEINIKERKRNCFIKRFFKRR